MIYSKRLLARKIAKDTGLTQSEMEGLVPLIFEAIKSILDNGDSVNIPDFGTFFIKKVNYKVTRVKKNLWKKGKYIEVSFVRFKVAKSFRKLIRKKRGRSTDKSKYFFKEE